MGKISPSPSRLANNESATPADLTPLNKSRRNCSGCKFLITLLVIIQSVVIDGDLLADIAASGPPFYADVLYFRDTDGVNTLTKIWVEVPYSSYVFVKRGDIYEASVETAVIFDNNNGLQMGGNTAADTIRTTDLPAASDRTRLFYFTFRITPGRYTMHIAISNKYGDNRHSGTLQLNVPSFQGPRPQISSLQLARKVNASAPESMRMANALAILPNVTHIVAGENRRCSLYCEVYNLTAMASSADSFQVICRLTCLGKEMRSFTMKHPLTGEKAMIDMRLDVTDLMPGDYMLNFAVLDDNGAPAASAAAVLYVVPQNFIFSRMIEDMPE